MDVQHFLAEFWHFANAPKGMARLRELVLHLAVSGRLTDQILGEDAGDLLDEIRATQTVLQSDGIIRVNRKIRSGKNPGSWQIPPNWIWCRLGELCNFSAGKTPSRKESKYWSTGDYPWFSIADLNHGKVVTASSETISEVARAEVFKSEPSPVGSLLMSFKLSIGKLSLLGVAAYHNEAIITIKPFAQELKEYFFKCLNGFDLAAGNKAAIKGSTLNRDSLSNILVALPPKNEISRIVAKVDELMALCDTLETQQQTRRKLQNNLRQSTLQAVASASSPYELQTTWAHLADNFGRLFQAPEDVDEFDAELKNMAVRGLLSSPSISPAPLDEVVADCDSLRGQYITSGLMRRQKIISVADSDVIYPGHWAIAPFDKVAVVIGGVTKGRDLRGRDVVTCPYLAVANVQRGFFRLATLKTIQIGKEELNKYLVKEGDLLITEGGDWDKVGRTAIWQGGVENCLHQNHVFKARVPSASLLNEWVALVFNSGVGRDYFAGASKQTTNLASINMTQLRSFPMPIPPLDEQREILAKLDALTKQAVVWREQLERRQRLASLLSSTTVAAFTGIAIEQREDPMKAPQTELIALLRLGSVPDIKAQAPLATFLARHGGEMSAKDLWQRFGGEIDAFYAQLKTEVAHGWILEPAGAEMREKLVDAVSS
jgi:type I restriction enzyme S subunit